MKLYHSPTSPYVRKVRVMLHMGGLAGMVELVPGAGTPLAPNDATLGANPLGKVPCLVADDGESIYDSRVICRYVDQLGGLGLYPAGADQFRVLTLEAAADGILDAGILAVYETRLRPEQVRFQPWIDAQGAKISRTIAVLEAESGFLDGPATAAQVAVGCALGYVDFRFGDLGWRASAPGLAAWYARFAETPEMVATAPKE